jgi:DNA-binding NtrC family response regulator
VAGKVPKQTDEPAVNQVPAGKETILLVEDEEMVRRLARSVLELKGYTVHEAPNGRVAMEIWNRQKDSIDLLLTDLIMPGDQSGRELAERLKTEKPGLRVIYCSGHSDDMLGSDFVLRRQFNFLQKPYNPSMLARIVRDCLDNPVAQPDEQN